MTNTATPKFSETEQWEMADELLRGGMGHEVLAEVVAAHAALQATLVEALEASRGLKRVGAGRTEDPTLVIARVLPALRELERAAKWAADRVEVLR